MAAVKHCLDVLFFVTQPVSPYDLMVSAHSETVAQHIIGATTALFVSYNSVTSAWAYCRIYSRVINNDCDLLALPSCGTMPNGDDTM
jgi:hypothetical protein